LSYQWSFGGSAINGATSASYSFTPTTTAQAGTYTVTVTNTKNGTTATRAATSTLNIAGALSILTPTTGLTGTVGTAFSLIISAGGGSSPLKYNPSGNSPAYPPHNLSSGLAVTSGGSSKIGIDGAIGGNWSDDLLGVAKTVAPLLPLLALGRKKKGGVALGTPENIADRKLGRKVGGSASEDFENVMKGIAHVAPHLIPLLGLGRTRKFSNAHKEKILKHLVGLGWSDDFANVMKGVAHVAPTLIPLLGLGHKVGSGASEDFENVMKGIAHVAPHLLPLLTGMGEGGKRRKKAVAKKGGLSLPSMSDIVEVLKPIGKEVGKMAINKGTDFVKRKALEAIGSGAKKGRSARAEIVKKVMKEKGMKMIEASKYVKAHNLY
jgi:hypothetical protein